MNAPDISYGMVRQLTMIIVAYVLALLASLRWHFLGDISQIRPSVGLFFVFALCAAMAGLISIWTAVSAMHWTKRLPLFIAIVALLAGGFLLFFDWNRDSVWGVLILILTQMLLLVGALIGLQFVGVTIQGDTTPGETTKQMSIKDVMTLIASVALLFAVLRYASPMAIGSTLYAAIFAAAFCAASVSFITLWVAFGNGQLLPRILVFSTFLPVGGFVYAIARQYTWLYFDSTWYAGVTSLQMILMLLPLILLRAHGYRFRIKSKGELRSDPDGV